MDVETLDYAPPPPRQSSSLVRSLLITGIVLLAIFIAFPFLLMQTGRSRPAANIIKCSSNLRQIGLCIQLYAASNDGAFPMRLPDLLLTTEITSDVFVCPNTDVDKAVGPTTQQIVDDLADAANNHCSYVYVGNGLNEKTAGPDDVIAFDRGTNHEGRINVLFADWHVDEIATKPGPPGAVYARLQADMAAGVRPLRLRP